MKLETQYNREGVEVVTHQAYFSSERQCVIKYDDPLEALDDAAAMLESAVGFMRNKYEQAWVIADADPEEEVKRDTFLIDAKLHWRDGNTYYYTRVPRDPAPRLVELNGRTFEIDMPNVLNLRGLTWCRYKEIDVYGAQERGSGGTLG